MQNFWKDESGATAIEYGLIAMLIAVAMVASLGNLGNSTAGAYQNIADNWPG